MTKYVSEDTCWTIPNRSIPTIDARAASPVNFTIMPPPTPSPSQHYPHLSPPALAKIAVTAVIREESGSWVTRLMGPVKRCDPSRRSVRQRLDEASSLPDTEPNQMHGCFPWGPSSSLSSVLSPINTLSCRKGVSKFLGRKKSCGVGNNNNSSFVFVTGAPRPTFQQHSYHLQRMHHRLTKSACVEF